jgi:hypothetical protein
MVGKRGFIKTVEAIIAIVIVLIVIFTLSKKVGNAEEYDVESVRSLMDGVLEGVSENEGMRDCIVTLTIPARGLVYSEYNAGNGDCGNDIVNKYVRDTLPKRFRYSMLVCEANLVCNIPDLPEGSVYTSAVLITSSVRAEMYKPRAIRLWMWLGQ